MRRFIMKTPVKKGFVNRFKNLLQKSIYYLCFHNSDASNLFCIYQRLAGKLAGTGRNQIAYHDFGYRENFIWDKKDWDKVVQLDFEGIKLNAPAGYDSVLKKEYGDYWQFPTNTATHDYYDFDPDLSYKQYFINRGLD